MSRPKKSEQASKTKLEKPIVNASADSQEPEQAKEEALEPEPEVVETNQDLPSLDEIKAKERALRKR